MADDKSDTKASDPLAGLKTLADYEKANPPGAPPKADGTPPGGKATATPGAKVVFENALGVGASDDVIDIPDRAAWDSLVEMVGGEGAVPAASEDLKQIIALAGIADVDGELEGLTLDEQNEMIAKEIREYREILGNPSRAQALLAKIYGSPMQEPGKSYFTGKGSPELTDAIARLWAATTGEKYVRPKSKGDGHVY